MKTILLLVFISWMDINCIFGIALSEFYPFGKIHGDQILTKGDDTVFGDINLRTTFNIFHRSHRKLYVNINGDISFDKGFGGYSPASIPFDRNNSIIAVYLVDLDTAIGGDILYRESTNRTILQSITRDIRSLFDGQTLFTATWSFIVTWNQMAAHSGKNKINTFQCVLVSNGQQSFVITFYHRLEIPGAQVGFDGGDGQHNFTLPMSKTDIITRIVTESNVKVPGKLIYRVDQTEIMNGTVDECRVRTCFNGGSCLNLPGLPSWRCFCKPGFMGTQCQNVIDECNYNNCYYGGTCIDLPCYLTWKCDCVPGFTGRNCETVIDECETKICHHNGSCIDLPGFPTWLCDCRPGYTDRHCQTDINECENATCVKGHCQDDINSYRCDCFFFAKGQSCSEFNVLPMIAIGVVSMTVLSVLCFVVWFKGNLPCTGNRVTETTTLEIKPTPAKQGYPNSWLDPKNINQINIKPTPAENGYPNTWLGSKNINQTKQMPAQQRYPNSWLQ